MTQLHNVQQLYADSSVTIAHAQYKDASVELDRANSSAADYYEQTCYYIKEARAAKENIRSVEQRYFGERTHILFPRVHDYGQREEGLSLLVRKMEGLSDKLASARYVRNSYRAAAQDVRQIKERLGADPSADHQPMVNEEIIMQALRDNDITLPHFQSVGPMTAREQGQDIPEVQTVLLKFLSSKHRAYLNFLSEDEVQVLALPASAESAKYLLSAADELNRQASSDSDKYFPDSYPGSFTFKTTNLTEALRRLQWLLKQAEIEAD